MMYIICLKEVLEMYYYLIIHLNCTNTFDILLVKYISLLQNFYNKQT